MKTMGLALAVALSLLAGGARAAEWESLVAQLDTRPASPTGCRAVARNLEQLAGALRKEEGCLEDCQEQAQLTEKLSLATRALSVELEKLAAACKGGGPECAARATSYLKQLDDARTADAQTSMGTGFAPLAEARAQIYFSLASLVRTRRSQGRRVAAQAEAAAALSGGSGPGQEGGEGPMSLSEPANGGSQAMEVAPQPAVLDPRGQPQQQEQQRPLPSSGVNGLGAGPQGQQMMLDARPLPPPPLQRLAASMDHDQVPAAAPPQGPAPMEEGGLARTFSNAAQAFEGFFADPTVSFAPNGSAPAKEESSYSYGKAARARLGSAYRTARALALRRSAGLFLRGSSCDPDRQKIVAKMMKLEGYTSADYFCLAPGSLAEASASIKKTFGRQRVENFLVDLDAKHVDFDNDEGPDTAYWQWLDFFERTASLREHPRNVILVFDGELRPMLSGGEFQEEE